jgi:hypothetical protein
MEIIMENTYWNNAGAHQNLVDQLNSMIPAMGGIKGSKNTALERFRRASNAYYDIFNNGGGNRGRSIGKFFEGVMFYINHYNRCNFGSINWDRIHMITEPKMDEIILAAATEQGIA